MDNEATTKRCFSHSGTIANPPQWQPFRLTAGAVPIWGRKTPCFMAHAQAVEKDSRTLITEYLDQHSHVSDVAGLEIFHASRSCAFVVHERDTDGAHTRCALRPSLYGGGENQNLSGAAGGKR